MSDGISRDLLVSLGFRVDHEPLDRTIEKIQILMGMAPQLERLKALGVHIDMRVTDEIPVARPHHDCPVQIFGRDRLPS